MHVLFFLVFLGGTAVLAMEAPPSSLPLRSPTPSPHAVALTETDADRLTGSLTVANAVNGYFSKPYKIINKHDKFSVMECTDGTVVYRANHSLAHGLRQAYLAVDIAIFFKNAKKENFENQAGKDLKGWVESKLTDSNFLKKIEFANAFQRSGRQSELNRTQNKEEYEKYLLADQENFQKEAHNYTGEGKLFKNPEEVNLFKRAIVEKFDKREKGVPEDVFFLSKIFYTAHLLDLRRLPTFSKDTILKNISLQLFETDTPKEGEKQLIDRLWSRSGDYLSATGDRDMDDPKKTDWNDSVFCAQAHNPQLLVEALQLARAKPEEKLLQSIVTHTQMIRELKEKKKSEISVKQTDKKEERGNEFSTEPEQVGKLRRTLENAPYTASEGYLKILLDDKYKEIPLTASEDIARQITIENVKTFLAEPKKVQDPYANQKTFIPRIENPDDQYFNMLVDCMMEERKNRGKVVLYHTTEPEMGFVFDVYTQLRNQLIMEGGKDIRALRVIDTEFLRLDEVVQKTRTGEEPKPKAYVKDFMKELKGVGDNNTKYRDMGLSTNFGLFGSDQQINADTYNMFYLVKDRIVATQPLDYAKFFSYIELHTGIPVTYDQYKSILDHFVLTCEDGKPCRNGRLIQIFVNPKILTDVAYFSVLMGAPVLKEGKNPSLDVPVQLLRTNPAKLIEYLENTSGAYVEGAQSYLLRPHTLKLHDLQARLFLRPEVMFDPKIINIKSYWRFGQPKDIKTYFAKIKDLVNQNLVTWLQQGAPSHPDAFTSETVKIKKFTQMVYKGSTGEEAPNSPPVPIEVQLVRLILDDKDNQAAKMLEDNYDNLLNKIFTIHPDQKGQGGGQYNLTELIKRYSSYPLLKLAFEKGIFKGGKETYQIALLMKFYRYVFLEALEKLKDPSETSRLILQHFEKYKLEEHYIVNLLIAIDSLDNNESIITASQPLLELFKGDSSDRVLKAVKKIPVADRQKVIAETLSILSYLNNPDIRGFELINAGLTIEGIIAQILEMQEIELGKRHYIWSIARQIGSNWESRLYLMIGIQSFDLDILKAIDSNLQNPPNKQYVPSMKKTFEARTINVIMQPFLSLLKPYMNAEELKEIILNTTAEFNRKEIMAKTLNSINTLNMTVYERKDTAQNLENIIKMVAYLDRKDPEQNHYHHIWLVAKQIKSGWPSRLKLMTILGTIRWIPDNPHYKTHISVPFNAEDVVAHADTKPKSYAMMFLKSEEGLQLITEIINKLNNHMVPENDLALAYNRHNPDAGYNKSLIADYASRLRDK